MCAENSRIAVDLDGQSQTPPGPPQRQMPGHEHEREGTDEQEQGVTRFDVLTLMAKNEPEQFPVEFEGPTRKQNCGGEHPYRRGSDRLG